MMDVIVNHPEYYVVKELFDEFELSNIDFDQTLLYSPWHLVLMEVFILTQTLFLTTIEIHSW
ncbi:hypothetical protein BK120_29870 [Paenibacillus sp. FSL A5-0031]|nr:hypothetical protein BK120_29870 [Paenibacillus sp. FSL A5-0031]